MCDIVDVSSEDSAAIVGTPRDSTLKGKQMTQQPENRGSTSYAESYRIVARRVGDYIVEHHSDLLLSSCIGGSPFGPTETDSYSFLTEIDPRLRVRGWQKLIYSDPARPMIGTLWLKNDVRNAHHKKWVLEVYGRVNVDRLRTIADELARHFNVEVHVRLESEHPRDTYRPAFD